MHFGTLLKDELDRRRETNPKYSARAMARDLGLSVGFFAQLLNGQRNLSQEKALFLVQQLAWPQTLRNDFLNLVRVASIKDPALKSLALKSVHRKRMGRSKFNSIGIERFKIVSEWYHFAIVELTMTPNFKSDPIWLGRRLGISSQLASDAIKRLLAVGLLKKSKNGQLEKCQANYTSGDVPSAAIRSCHQQLLTKALRAIDEQAPVNRDFSGITMAIDPRRIPRAKKMIASFRRDIMDLLEGGEPSKIYHLSLQLFSLEEQE